MRAKRLVFDAKTGKSRVEEFEFKPRELEPEPEGVDLRELARLLPKLKRLLERERL